MTLADRLCAQCQKPLPKGRRKYCSDECSYDYWKYHYGILWWNVAKGIALERAGRKCEVCGAGMMDVNLEVHHIEKLDRGEDYHNSPKNQQDNLRVLCRQCHEEMHHSHIKSIHAAAKAQTVMQLDIPQSSSRQLALEEKE